MPRTLKSPHRRRLWRGGDVSGEGCLKDVPKMRPSAQSAEQLHADAREKRLSFKFTCLCLYFGFRNLCPREPLSFPSNLRRLVASSQVEERKIRRNLWSRCTSLHERKMKLPAFFYRFWRSSRQGWEEGWGSGTQPRGQGRLKSHLTSLHKGLILFMGMIRQSVIKG